MRTLTAYTPNELLKLSFRATDVRRQISKRHSEMLILNIHYDYHALNKLWWKATRLSDYFYNAYKLAS